MNNAIGQAVNTQSTVNFKAVRLHTDLRGRNNIINGIGKELEKLTKHMPDDTLYIGREMPMMRSSKADSKNIYVEVPGALAIINDFKALLSKNPSEVTKQDIKDSAKRLLNMYKLLTKERSYKEKLDENEFLIYNNNGFPEIKINDFIVDGEVELVLNVEK